MCAERDEAPLPGDWMVSLRMSGPVHRDCIVGAPGDSANQDREHRAQQEVSLHDVIVVGAGPAGNIAALRLSGMGYRVVVLDWRQQIGDKLCTGIIGTECAEHYPIDQAHVYGEAKAATVVSPAGNRYQFARPDTHAFITNRVAYVEALAQRAMEAGADYQLGPRVADIEVTPSGVAVSTSGDGGRYRAEVVIIASGFGSRLLDTVGLRNGRGGDFMTGAQAEVSIRGLEGTEVYLGEHIAPGSFGWVVPLSDRSALVGLVSRRELNGHMGRFIAGLRSEGKVQDVIKEPRQWGIPLRPLPKTYGERVLVVGDAAGLVKPTTGGGIYYAILSGEISAEVVNEAFVAGDFSGRQLRHYEKRWKTLIGRELSVGYYARAMYEALGDRQIERLLSTLSAPQVQDELVNSHEFSFDWHSGVILKAVLHRYMGGVIRSFGPVVTPFLSRLVSAKSR